MKLLNYIIGASALLGLGLTACDDDDIVEVNTPLEMQSASLQQGALISPSDVTELAFTFNHPVRVADPAGITLNGQPVQANANILELRVPVALNELTEYTFHIAPGALVRYEKQALALPEYTLTFSTKELPKVDLQLTNPNATQGAVDIYNLFLANYGEKCFSGCMGEVAWNTTYYDNVTAAAGAAPKIIGFDYIHLPDSPSNWVDYSDITNVVAAWNAGAIPAFTWHWQVPDHKGESTLLLEQECSVGAWANYIQMGPEYFSEAKVGNQILVNVKDIVVNSQGSFKNAGTWAAIAPGFEYFDIKGAFSLPITQEILDVLQTKGLIIGGQNYTITSVSLATVAEGELGYRNAFSPAAAAMEGTWENGVINQDLAKVAGYLQLLQEAGIAVIWRPFHEAAGDYTWGNWFWWGNDGPEGTKALWRYVYNKLTNDYGINNLIWVWVVQTVNEGKLASLDLGKNAYPGDDVVDIISTDIYNNADLMTNNDEFEYVNSVANGRKMVALAETGKLQDFDASFEAGATWLYFMQWYDDDGSSTFMPGSKNYSSADIWARVAAMNCVANR